MTSGRQVGRRRVIRPIAGVDRGPGQAQASLVLPTPGGPMKSTLVASSKKRSVPSSVISFLSTEGWAEKSKSSSVHGDGKQAKRSSPARRRISVALTSTSRRRCKNSECPSPSLRAYSSSPGSASAAAPRRR